MGCKCACPRGGTKAAGLAMIAFSLGIIAGLLCPLCVLAAAELAVLGIVGYLCMFKL